MSQKIYEFSKLVLERVSFDATLFSKELFKAIQQLLPYEIENLKDWLIHFTSEKPELKPSLLLIN